MIVFEKPGQLLCAPEQTLLTAVNLELAKMKGGLPVSFRYAFPLLLENYVYAHKHCIFENDGYFVFEDSPLRKVLCLPVKLHRSYSTQEKLDSLEESLNEFALGYEKHAITSLAVNEIGYPDLPWQDVRALIYHHLDRIELPVSIYTEHTAIDLQSSQHHETHSAMV